MDDTMRRSAASDICSHAGAIICSHAGGIAFATVFALVLAGCSGPRATAEEEAPEQSTAIDVGYGTADKDHVVGSVATIDGEDAQIEQPTSLADMLRGRATGVHVTEAPGGGIRVRVRGSDLGT